VEGARVVAGVHRRRNVPATFFIVGRCLEEHGRELRGILDDELFDLQSHTYSHALLRDSLVHGPGVSEDDVRREILEGVRLVRAVLGRACEALRSPCGFSGGFRGREGVLRVCREMHLGYLSSDARGSGDSLPAPLKRPYTYAEEGYPDIWELPVHGWHDNVLKGFAPGVAFMTYPPGEQWYLPPKPPETPEEDAEHHLLWVEKAGQGGLPFVSLAFHPWSLIRFDPQARELDIILDRLAEKGIAVVTATEAWRKLKREGESR
jgi:peptidoglycan/xylan/chitin deacetylase (PgdA/CDA1 family)